MPATLEAVLGQFPVSLHVERNLACIREIIACARPGNLVVLPEGALSGYEEDPAFLGQLHPREIGAGIERLRSEARERSVHLFFGSCWQEQRRWFNAGLYASPSGEFFVYRKANLATRERGHFTAGNSLPILALLVGNERVPVAIQLCRELRYPEQWRYLAEQGALIFIYMTNGVGDSREYPVWRAHLVSRAAENQRFVLSVNNAHEAQKCPTLAVSPTGNVLTEAPSGESGARRLSLDLGLPSDWYLSQSRRDLVETVYRGEHDSKPKH
jgi:predicted amidohydrolase